MSIRQHATWPSVQLQEVCNFQNGYAFKNKDFQAGDADAYVVLKMGHIEKGGGLRSEPKNSYISREKCTSLTRFVLNKGDLVMSMTDMKASMALLGHTARIDADDKYILNQRVGRITIRDTERLDPAFLFHYTNSPDYIAYLRGVAHSGVQVNLSTQAIKQSPISLPPKATQEQIGSILSAYDDLIENNLRRIKILEEMAQNLYREWFVNFCFPGHEKVRMVDSDLGKVPEYWQVVPLEVVCDRITDGAHRSPKTVEDGVPMASVKDMHDWGITVETCRQISEEDFSDLVRNDCRVREGDVLIAKDGSYLKHCFVVEKTQAIALLSSIAMLRPNELIEGHLLALLLRDTQIKERMKGYVSGAALPRIILKDFKKFLIVLPPQSLQAEWSRKAQPMVELCWRLIDANTALRETRDLLLPRLISSELDVSDLDIEAPEEAA